jgi:hypothetical protein
MKTVFKVGDKVFDIKYGWGVVNRIDDGECHPVHVSFFIKTESYKYDGSIIEYASPSLSFTEYTLQGFSQERPVALPEVGELVLVRNQEIERWRTFEFHSFDGLLYNCLTGYQDGFIAFKECKRFKFIEE